MPKRSMLDWTLEACALALLVALFANMALHWHQLPESVPRHFNADGIPDRWGNKASMWTMPVVGLLLYCGLSILSRFARFYNVPFEVDRTSPEVLGVLRRTVIVLKAVMLLTFGYVSWAAIHTALGEAGGLGRGFMPVVLIGTITVPAWFLLKLRQYRVN